MVSISIRHKAAVEAAAACGVAPDQGRAWLDAAKAGHVGTLSSMLASNLRLLHYKASGTEYVFHYILTEYRMQWG